MPPQRVASIPSPTQLIICETLAWDREPAPFEAVDALFDHLEQVLTKVDFLDADNPGQVMTRFRRLFLRIRLDDTEVKMLRGALTEIERTLGAGRPDTGPK